MTGDGLSRGLSDMWRSVVLFLPSALMFLAIMIVGYLLARLARAVTAKTLRRVGFDRAVQRGPAGRLLKPGAPSATDVCARLAFFIVLLFAAQLAFGLWGPNPAGDLINALISWLPQVFVAIVIVVVTAAIAGAAHDLILAVLGSLGYARVLAKAAAAVIVTLGVIAGLDQIGIATSVTRPLLITILATVAGVIIVGVGGGLVRPMQQRWQVWLDVAATESAVIRSQARAYAEERARRTAYAAHTGNAAHGDDAAHTGDAAHADHATRTDGRARTGDAFRRGDAVPTDDRARTGDAVLMAAGASTTDDDRVRTGDAVRTDDEHGPDAASSPAASSATPSTEHPSVAPPSSGSPASAARPSGALTGSGAATAGGFAGAVDPAGSLDRAASSSSPSSSSAVPVDSAHLPDSARSSDLAHTSDPARSLDPGRSSGPVELAGGDQATGPVSTSDKEGSAGMEVSGTDTRVPEQTLISPESSSGAIGLDTAGSSGATGGTPGGVVPVHAEDDDRAWEARWAEEERRARERLGDGDETQVIVTPGAVDDRPHFIPGFDRFDETAPGERSDHDEDDTIFVHTGTAETTIITPGVRPTPQPVASASPDDEKTVPTYLPDSAADSESEPTQFLSSVPTRPLGGESAPEAIPASETTIVTSGTDPDQTTVMHGLGVHRPSVVDTGDQAASADGGETTAVVVAAVDTSETTAVVRPAPIASDDGEPTVVVDDGERTRIVSLPAAASSEVTGDDDPTLRVGGADGDVVGEDGEDPTLRVGGADGDVVGEGERRTGGSGGDEPTRETPPGSGRSGT